MKDKKFFLLIFFVAVSFSCFDNKNEISRTIEKLYVNNAYFDIGSINNTQSTIYNFVFKLENIGDKKIILNNVEPSCNCLVLHDVPKYIPPHGNIVLRGYINTKRQKGNLSKSIYVDFDDNKVMLLRVVGVVK